MANLDRRCRRERRDWDVFVYPERRAGHERRSSQDRRQFETPFPGPERRQGQLSPNGVVSNDTQTPTPSKRLQKSFYTTAEVADITGLSQATLLLWIRNKVIDGSRIKRSTEGKRLWTDDDIEEVKRVKTRNGWRD